MSAFYKLLSPMGPDGTAISLLLLALHLLFGGLLLLYGTQKWMNFESMSTASPDPLEIGYLAPLGLATFGKLFCSIGSILGALYWSATTPMTSIMGVVSLVIHGNDPFSLKESTLVYLAIFILMYVVGPGKFSLDRLIAVLLLQKR